MTHMLKGKTVLITGATGSFGVALLEKVLTSSPRAVRVYSRDEAKQFSLSQSLSEKNRALVRFFIGDVRDENRLTHAMENVDYVFHLAAMKHVFACEYNPLEAMKTNIIGTANVIEAAIVAKVKKVIFTSTDKAVNPCNAMGASKLFAERLTTAAHYYRGNHDTVFCTVRFGNVLGSRGSLVPIIEDQIKNGTTVTLTDGEMERYVMSLAQCLSLVLRVAEVSLGGEVFVLKMPIVKINDLVAVLVDLLAAKYKKNPKNIHIQTIGPKPGEKFYEELLTEEETARSLESDDMYVVLPQMQDLIREGLVYNGGYRKVKTIAKKYLNRKEIKALLLKEGIVS